MVNVIERVIDKSLPEFIAECVVVTLLIEGGPAVLREMNKVVRNVIGNGEPKTDVVKEESKVVEKDGKTTTTRKRTSTTRKSNGTTRKGQGTSTATRKRTTNSNNGSSSTTKAPPKRGTREAA